MRRWELCAHVCIYVRLSFHNESGRERRIGYCSRQEKRHYTRGVSNVAARGSRRIYFRNTSRWIPTPSLFRRGRPHASTCRYESGIEQFPRQKWPRNVGKNKGSISWILEYFFVRACTFFRATQRNSCMSLTSCAGMTCHSLGHSSKYHSC